MTVLMSHQLKTNLYYPKASRGRHWLHLQARKYLVDFVRIAHSCRCKDHLNSLYSWHAHSSRWHPATAPICYQALDLASHGSVSWLGSSGSSMVQTGCPRRRYVAQGKKDLADRIVRRSWLFHLATSWYSLLACWTPELGEDGRKLVRFFGWSN